MSGFGPPGSTGNDGQVGPNDVEGPSSATDNAITRYDGTTGKLVQNSVVTIDDSGNIALAALATVDGRDISVDGTALDAKITGPGSATDNCIVRFDSTTGKLAQNSGVAVDDSNGISGHTAVLNAQTGTTYTVAASDTGKHVLLTNASAITVTVPASLLAGFQCTWEQGGAGQVSFSGSAVTAATLNNRQSQTKAAGQHAVGGLSCKTGTGSNAVVTLFGDTGA